MIKKFNLKLIVFIIACLYSSMLSAQINTPSGAVVPFNSNPNYGTNGIMPTNLPSGGTYGKSQDAADAYNEWKANYVQACGSMYRVKFDDPSLTVSEGIGYGMQLAAYAADKNLFDGLYAYWKSFASPNSSGKTGKLMNWRVSGCGPTVTGTGSAADADADAAWALLVAATQWPSATSPYNYASEATNMMYAIKELELASNGQLINGDGWGFSNTCRNPSYQSPAYYKTFATINTAYASSWNSGVTGAYTLINANASSTTGLVSDWSDPSGVRNTCNPGGLGYAATNGYGYDACRNPWRMAQDVLWNNDASAKAVCTKIAAYLNGRGSTGNVGGPLNQDGTNYSGYAHNATFVSTFAMGVMGSTSTYQTLMNSMYTEVKNTKDVIQNQTLSGYFGNTLRCVSLFMMTGNFWKYGTTSFQDINVRQGALNVPSATSFDFQNQQTTPPATSGKTITFTIENLGFAALNLTGTTKVAVSGTDAALFTVVQPTASSLALSATTTFTVTFTPTTTGTKTAVLTIANNDPDASESPYIINLTGTGTANSTAPKMTVYDTVNVLNSSSTLAMGSYTVSTVGSKLIKITNTGDAPLNLNSATFTGANPTAFSILNVVGSTSVTYPIVVPIGGTKYISIGYTAPATATSSSATLTFATTDPNAPSYVLNVTASAAACSATPASNILDDYDGNINVKLAFTPTGTFSQAALNQYQTGLNLSPTVASYVRGTTGTYDIIRYYNCGTTAGATHAASTYVAFNLTTANPTIQILMYSPAVGITITVAPQKPDLTTASAWLPLISDYSSNISVVTTKANQWELLTFDMSKVLAAGVQANFKCLDIQIDPLLAYAGLAANAAASARTFYLDQIKYGINPCVNDLSGILEDYDTHNNLTLDYANAALVAPIANPVSGGVNTSANVGQFTKTINAATYDDGIRYDGCSNKIDFSTKKYISMLVYAPVANANIQVSAKVPDGADADTYPDDAAAFTTQTVFANKWHRIYFDLSTISAANLPNVFAIDIFFDPTDLSAVSAPNNKFYFDDIRLESALPCVTGIPATNILNDFENNRYLSVAFPLSTSGAAPYFNTIKSNPYPTGINTSAIVGEFLRGTGTTGTSVRFTACQNKLDLSAGHNIIEVKVYSPNAGVTLTMSLKTSAGVSVSDVTDTIKTANTWTTLRFDHTNVLNATNVDYIDLIVDGAGTFSSATSTVAQRTYEFDDLQYSAPSPEINIKALTTPTTTDIPSTGSFAMGTAAIGDSTSMDFSILNDGLQSLTLTGTGAAALVLGGANPGDFIISTTQTFSTSVGALGATGFTVKFKPTAGGARSAKITITSNDADEGTYVIYLTGIATVPVINVLNGGTVTSPVIANNNTTAISVGTSPVGVAATPAYTFSIKNTGAGPLTVTSVIASTGFVASALSSTTPILQGTIATFTITGTPATTGINAGTIVIKTNDPTTPTYTVNISVTGSVPVITVKDATSTVVANNNTVFLSVGSAPVGTAATPYTFTIANTGTAPLSVTSITGVTGFVASSITPTGAIAAGGTATFTVTATPAASGTNGGTITIATTDPVTPSYKVNVTVTGTTPAIQVFDGTTTTTQVTANNTPAISVGSASVGSAATPAHSFTIKNNGLAPLTNITLTPTAGFVVSALTPTGSIAAGATATFTVTGTPAVAGANTGSVTIASNDPTTPSFKVNVSVTGNVPTIQVLDGTTPISTNNTPAISVGSSVVLTAASPYTITIKNTGGASLTGVTVTGSTGFAVSVLTPASSTIAAGASATFTITGTPAAVGTNTGTITIASNDPTTPSFKVNVTVTGTAAATPTIQVLNGTTNVPNGNTPAISVGSALVGVAATPFTFTIKNTGAATLSSIAIAGSTGFVVSTLTPSGTSIAASGSATFTVTATPAVAGTNTGTITITSNDPLTPSYVVNVSVTGNVPAIQIFDGTTTTTQVTTNNTPAISVGTATVGVAATPSHSFTIKNNGTAPLTGVTVTGVTGFVVSALTPASTTIAAGATATFTVTGTPATVGANTGVVTIASNDPTTPSFKVNVSVTGTAAPAALQVLNGTTALTTNNTPAISVGTAVVGSAASAYTSFSIKNNGGSALTFTSITSSSAAFVVSAVTPAAPTSIAAGANATFTVTATPAAVGANTATITIVTNDPTTPSFVLNVSVTGTSAPTPALQVLNNTTVVTNNSAAISVGSSTIGTPAAAYTSFSIKNNGAAALTFTSITSSSAAFVVSAVTPAAPTSIAVGASATFTVTATPAAVGANTATITIVTNDPTTPSFVLNVSVTGTSAPTPALQVLNNTTVLATNNTPAISVGTAVVGSAATAYTSFSIKNNGAAALTFTSITSSSAAFVVSAVTPAAPTSIAVGASATFTVTATPAAAGTNTATITIVTNDPTTPSFVLNVSVTGTTAPVPALQVLNNTSIVANNATAISVGSAVINTAASPYTSFSIKNNGSAALTFTSITSSSAAFVVSAVTPATPTSIAAGSTATFTVTATPTTVGTNTAAITIVTNDPTTPTFTLNVSATGTSAPIPPTVTVSGATNNGPEISLGSAVEGNPTATKTFSITNTGTSPLTIGTIVSSDPAFTVTQVSPNPIPAGGTGTFTVVATPTTIGHTSGTITIPSNDPNSPFVINVGVDGTAAPVGPAIQILDGTTIIANNSTVVAIGANAAGVATSVHYFTVKNIGSLPLTISSIFGSTGFTATQISPSGSIAPGATAIFKASGTPTSTTPTVGSITISSNDISGNTPFILNVSVVVGTPTGLTKTLAATAIDLYPNPSNGNATLDFNGTFDDVSVIVYKADGSHVYNADMSTVADASKPLELEELPAGVYFVEVNTAQGKLVKRMIKQ